MNTHNEDKKTALTKSLAIVGLFGLLVFGGWLAVKVVTLVPTAFSSLASLADGVRVPAEEADEILVTVGETVVADDAEFEINWTTPNDVENGTYYFRYACTEGVSLALAQNGDILSCNERIAVPNGALALIASSEKNRFTDIPLTVEYEGETENQSTESSTVITVVNATIDSESLPEVELTDVSPDDEVDGAVSEDELFAETPAEEPTPVVASESTTVAVDETQVDPTPAPAQSEAVEFTFAVPENDPEGYSDLAVRFLGVGHLTDSDDFVLTNEIDNDERGAFQFEVKNLGTKTSEEWAFVANLPSGLEFDSRTQAPLRPNERSVLTLGFTMPEETGIRTFSVALEHDEVNTSNNTFTWAVTVNN